jgi:hypothetical protein
VCACIYMCLYSVKGLRERRVFLYNYRTEYSDSVIPIHRLSSETNYHGPVRENISQSRTGPGLKLEFHI